MAIDRKADHVGDHGGRYTDIDGMSRQFTYIDHDKKIKVGISSDTPFNQEWEALESAVKGHPLTEIFLNENDLEWGVNINLGHLRKLKNLIDESELQTVASTKDSGESTSSLS